jgi:hypothetical protein
MEKVCIFCYHSECIKAIWYLGTYYGHLIIYVLCSSLVHPTPPFWYIASRKIWQPCFQLAHRFGAVPAAAYFSIPGQFDLDIRDPFIFFSRLYWTSQMLLWMMHCHSNSQFAFCRGVCDLPENWKEAKAKTNCGARASTERECRRPESWLGGSMLWSLLCAILIAFRQ